ncbi:hypothetical protein Salat_1422900 [Sesamum alatum]|uniref:Uncharacterized protein n=1 Tax=Sesamum alatum TaxID=300844 RepID=A0AAE2CLH9_9LAMI|nr:hypothetical protein Salat_1422900 [Sesamum alatum]
MEDSSFQIGLWMESWKGNMQSRIQHLDSEMGAAIDSLKHYVDLAIESHMDEENEENNHVAIVKSQLVMVGAMKELQQLIVWLGDREVVIVSKVTGHSSMAAVCGVQKIIVVPAYVGQRSSIETVVGRCLLDPKGRVEREELMT